MNPVQRLYYGLGQLAYAVAWADETVQKEEKEKFRQLLRTEFRNEDTDCSEIIFHILEKDKMDSQTAYEWAVNEMRANSTLLNEKRKQQFIRVIDKVAEAFPPVTEQEKNYLRKFRTELSTLHN